MRLSALNTSPETLFLDHISPLASLLQIPLIVKEEENVLLTSKYYPEVEMRHWPDLEFRFRELAAEFDALLECNYWWPQTKQAFRSLWQKEMQLIFCPHGQSDKGYGAPSLAPYAFQEAVLLYGDLLKEMLVELKLWNETSHAFIGNFRFLYYQKHRARLDATAEAEIFSHLPSSNRTLLYAPTWKDDDQSSTYFEFGERVVRETPSNWNLIVKIHPLLPQKDPSLFYRLSLEREKKQNVLIVDQFPFIYPILSKIDAYLGDYSSVGYDALVFEKPMFFLKRSHILSPRLHSCGTLLNPLEPLFQSIERHLPKAHSFLPLQRALLQKAFAPVKDVRQAILPLVKAPH